MEPFLETQLTFPTGVLYLRTIVNFVPIRAMRTPTWHYRVAKREWLFERIPLGGIFSC